MLKRAYTQKNNKYDICVENNHPLVGVKYLQYNSVHQQHTPIDKTQAHNYESILGFNYSS